MVFYASTAGFFRQQRSRQLAKIIRFELWRDPLEAKALGLICLAQRTLLPHSYAGSPDLSWLSLQGWIAKGWPKSLLNLGCPFGRGVRSEGILCPGRLFPWSPGMSPTYPCIGLLQVVETARYRLYMEPGAASEVGIGLVILWKDIYGGFWWKEPVGMASVQINAHP